MKRVQSLLLFTVCLLCAAPGAIAQRLNDKVLNRPYADNRRWHLGFSVGTFVDGLRFTHNGFESPEGEKWFMEQPSYSPGFCVNGLFDVRLNNYFSVRVSPGMYFGNREVTFLETVSGEKAKQNIKSAFVVMPVDLKFASLRLKNMRPYITTGIMPAFDVSKKRSDYLKLKSPDFYLSVGLGCDFYLPYFKLIPELKFCFGLTDVIEHDRPDLVDDPKKTNVTSSLKKATSQMVVLTFYFE